MVFGREGNYVLANGRHRPVLKARSGAPQRWRIVNAAKSRFFYLDLDGQEFTVIGVDGGIQERPAKTDILLVTAGERVDVIVTPKGKPGSPLPLRAMLYNRGYGSVEYRSVEDVLTIEFTSEPPVTAKPITIDPRDGIAVNRRRHAGGRRADPAADAEQHLRVPGEWRAVLEGETVRGEAWRETAVDRQERSDWDHPFHLHGFFFHVIDEKGEPVRPLALKDTVNVPMKSTVRLLVDFNERPGQWMFHCHILDHAEGGLMGTVLVGPVKPSAHVHTKTP